MLDKELGEFVVACDRCSKELLLGTDDFHDAMDVMKAQGWRAYKEDGDWWHKCKECVKEWAEKQN